jgi:hypothetical protein
MVFLLTPNHQLPFLAAVSILPSTAPFPVLHLPFSVFFFFPHLLWTGKPDDQSFSDITTKTRKNIHTETVHWVLS